MPTHHSPMYATPPSPVRRLLISSMVSGYIASRIPWAIAQTANDFGHGAFMATSAILVGRTALDTALGNRLYEALQARDPDFPSSVRNLLTLISELQLDPLLLQKVLDDAHPKLATIPRHVVSAWYLGTVGEGREARCLAYEQALNAVVVGDVLTPPSYALGAYGSWTRKPVMEASHD